VAGTTITPSRPPSARLYSVKCRCRWAYIPPAEEFDPRASAACRASSRKLPPPRCGSTAGSPRDSAATAPFRQGLVIGDQEAGIAQRAQVLGGEEADGSKVAERANRPAAISRAEGLGGVFDHRQPAPPGNLEDRVHIRRLAEQVHGDDGLGAAGDERLNAAGRQVEAFRARSANTGLAPTRAMHPAVAKKVNDGQMTSSPGPIPSAISATRMASVPEDMPMPKRAPATAAAALSNCSTPGPRMNCPDVRTRRKASSKLGFHRQVLKPQVQ